jgi:DNA-directed RNA polymerase subunit RPC12/RpoP
MDKKWTCVECGKTFTQEEVEELDFYDGTRCDRPVEDDMLCGGIVVLEEFVVGEKINNMSMEEIIKFAERNEEVIEILDDLVDDYKSIEATNINNCGPQEQIAYLIESGMTWEDIKNELIEEIE